MKTAKEETRQLEPKIIVELEEIRKAEHELNVEKLADEVVTSLQILKL